MRSNKEYCLEYNRAVENCARFAAFVTSREMGRSIDRSVYDAKEISVNFNKKGSGAKFLESAGQTKAGNVAALVSGLGCSGYVFWNAAIQGTTNFGRQIKRHPAKAFTGAAAMFLLGAVTAYLGGDDDDDKNAYYNLPEWTKAYKSANKYMVGLAEVMNEATGGDAYTKGAVDINPAKVEYLLNGYFGGVSGTIDKMVKTAETIAGTREYDPRSVLLMNRLVKAGDESTEYRAVNNEYFRLKEEHDRTKKRLRNYEKDTERGIFDYAEKIDFLYNSPEYARYEIFESYRKEIDGLYDELKEAVDDKERKEIEVSLNEVKKEMIGEMNKTRKRK